MLAKLRVMQTEMDGMELEMKKKESEVSVVNLEKDKMLERLHDEEAARSRDKRMLMDEVIQLKKEKDAFEREIGHKDYQLAEARTELDKSATALKNADLKLQTLRTQLEQREEQQRMIQISLEEKRTELISAETQLRELEDKYYNSTVTVQDKIVDELREEIRTLRQKLKETEMAADHDRYLKDKMGDDNSHLVKENAILNQQITELQKQIERLDMKEQELILLRGQLTSTVSKVRDIEHIKSMESTVQSPEVGGV
ncbi:hypothetical protein KUTeg_000243 [Tegillarca granosa]|uniref:Uncharacterized protein n=1 Tax=Tegillarca granosa TaxID=220873 RepID=A0ABQ9FWZ2_TEGGR|nr:hypothetical protein KUTeg_000243 [Tegillarca granosa]